MSIVSKEKSLTRHRSTRFREFRDPKRCEIEIRGLVLELVLVRSIGKEERIGKYIEHRLTLLGFVRLVARTLGCASLLLAAAEASLRLKTTTLPDRLRGVRALRLMHRMLLRGMYRASWWARFYHRLICHREIRILIL